MIFWQYFRCYCFNHSKSNCGLSPFIFGGGGGTILPEEIDELHNYGITKIYSPDDGRELGLQGMINDLVKQSDFAIGDVLNGEINRLIKKEIGSLNLD